MLFSTPWRPQVKSGHLTFVLWLDVAKPAWSWCCVCMYSLVIDRVPEIGFTWTLNQLKYEFTASQTWIFFNFWHSIFDDFSKRSLQIEVRRGTPLWRIINFVLKLAKIEEKSLSTNLFLHGTSKTPNLARFRLPASSLVCTPPWTSQEHKKLPDAAPLLRLQKQGKASIISSRKSSGTATTVSIFRATTLTSSQANSTASRCSCPPVIHTHKKGVKYVFKRGQCFTACALLLLLLVLVNSWKYICM